MSSFLNSQSRIEFTPDPLGGVIDPEGCHCDSESDAVMHYLVGSTGGFRDDVFGFVASVLRDVGTGHGDGLRGIADIIERDPRVAAEFVANVLAHGNLLEAAGFVYWTTPRGEQWVEIADKDAGDEA
ncbi:hypothetical protein ABIA25_002907 [Sinorhizobium fredii]|uniref:hypothetical protein n=1 Tax=Rhizobium fredii TaxID=380 RepID=UPI003515E881